MPYSHPMPVVSFTTTVIGENLFVFSAGGEGLIRAWQYNKATNVFSHVSMLEGHTRGITALLFTGSFFFDSIFHRALIFVNIARRRKLVVRVDGSLSALLGPGEGRVRGHDHVDQRGPHRGDHQPGAHQGARHGVCFVRRGRLHAEGVGHGREPHPQPEPRRRHHGSEDLV